MKILIETKHYPDAGIKVLRKCDASEKYYLVIIDCCGRLDRMSRGTIIERIRIGKEYLDQRGYTIPCRSCTKILRMPRKEENRKKPDRRTLVEPIFSQIKIPDWPSRPGDIGYWFWKGSLL